MTCIALYQRVARARDLHCVLVDEAQFLQREQVLQLTDVVDKGKVPVLSYGLRTDFRGELFEGSRYLLAWADELREIKTICHCGRKATMVVRMNENGEPVRDGEQILSAATTATCRCADSTLKRVSAGSRRSRMRGR